MSMHKKHTIELTLETMSEVEGDKMVRAVVNAIKDAWDSAGALETAHELNAYHCNAEVGISTCRGI